MSSGASAPGTLSLAPNAFQFAAPTQGGSQQQAGSVTPGGSNAQSGISGTGGRQGRGGGSAWYRYLVPFWSPCWGPRGDDSMQRLHAWPWDVLHVPVSSLFVRRHSAHKSDCSYTWPHISLLAPCAHSTRALAPAAGIAWHQPAHYWYEAPALPEE